MPLTPEVQPWRIKAIPGMNTKMENFELQANWVEKAQNCRFEEELGAVSKRAPVSYYNSGANKIGNDPIVGIQRFYTSSGTAKFVAAAGTGIYVGNDTTGACTLIRTLGQSGKRCAFIPYGDLLYVFNGFDNPFIYDGSSDNVTWESGACKAVLASGGSNLDAAATYTYKITFDADSPGTDDAIVTGAVSNTVTTNSDHRKVSLSHIPLGPVGCANRNIYRTNGGGTTAFYLIATISDNTTTTYEDDIADNTTTAIPTVTDAPPKGNIPIMYRERLFLAGDPNNPNTVYYSYPYLPHIMLQISGPDTLEVSPDDNDEITGLAVFLGSMLCIKKNNIRKMYVAGPDSSWYAEDPLVFAGTPAPWSVVSTNSGVIFLGWDHWYRFNGSSVEPIIDEFDTADILPARYSETVSFYHEDHLLAAYTDLTLATQYHNRVMRYNMKRQKLSYDTISANCFTAKRGGNETGELYYGSSVEGFILKGSNEEVSYRLSAKNDVNAGTTSGTYIGGTQAEPYIEIGSVASASEIPTDICIFWDDEYESPGSGWTEIIGGGKAIKIHTTAGTEYTTSHTHSITGTLPLSGAGRHDGGDSEGIQTADDHTHNVSGTSASSTAYPRSILYRMFKKNATTTEYAFPEGSILMYDQTSAPEGWQVIGTDGYYIRVDTTGLGENISSTHDHTFSFNSDATTAADATSGVTGGGPHAASHHYHPMSGTTYDATQDTWELDYVSFRFIKKIGEESTWDGVLRYVYALFAAATAVSNSWEDMSSTYTGLYLKIGTGAPSTGVTANNTHSHTVYAGTSSNGTPLGSPYGGYHTQPIDGHAHSWQSSDLTCNTSAAITDVPHVTYRIFRKVLGKMNDYNAAIETAATSGTWTSPSLEINASSLGKMYWNELVTGLSDDVHLHVRAGATQTACEAASWSAAINNSNGVDLPAYVTTNLWVQYMIQFTATDSTVANPRVYFSDGFLVQFFYSQAAVYAETTVEFIYSLGYRNFDMPMVDKIHKKIGTVHEGYYGSFKVIWETENSFNEFTVSLDSNPERWSSFFQDDAMGEKLNITIYKNDLYDFMLKEINGFYCPEPLLL